MDKQLYIVVFFTQFFIARDDKGRGDTISILLRLSGRWWL
jgi:hypothetical protein